MYRLLVLLWVVLCLTCSAAHAQYARAGLDELKRNYQSHIDNGNWVGAEMVGNTILDRFPNSDFAKEVSKRSPEIKKKAADQRTAANAARQAAEKKERAAKEAAQKAAVGSLRRKRDEVERITFYYAPNTSLGVANQWALYLAVPDSGKPYMRFKWMYVGDSWLFIQKVTLNVDGKNLGSVPISYFAVNRDNSGGQVWEWHDEGVDTNDLSFFQTLAKSKKTIIRYEGRQYYKDRILTEGEKKAFLQIMTAYQVLQRGGLTRGN